MYQFCDILLTHIEIRYYTESDIDLTSFGTFLFFNYPCHALLVFQIICKSDKIDKGQEISKANSSKKQKKYSDFCPIDVKSLEVSWSTQTIERCTR